MMEGSIGRFFNGIALKGILKREVDVPSYQLGVAPYETLSPIVGGKPALSQSGYVKVDKPNMQNGQTQVGIPGFGDLIPMVSTGDIPYYGEYLGGN